MLKTRYTYLLLCFISLHMVYTMHGGTVQPVAKFTFNNKADYDEVSGRKIRLNGVMHTKDRFNNPNNAVFISGNSFSYINLGNYPALKPQVGSISMWVKIEGAVRAGKGPDYNPILITKNTSGEDFYEAYGFYYVFRSGRLLCVTSKDSLSEIALYSNREFLRNDWHHLVMTFDDHQLAFYVDGVLNLSSQKHMKTVYLATDSVLVGSTGSSKNIRYMSGWVDDLAFYDRVLSDQEVTELYHAPNPNKNTILLYWVLAIAGFTGLLVLIYFYIRHRLRLTLMKEKQQLELSNKLLETELRVNRALMNPHFIFNSLSSLQNLILKNENDQANYYLVKFSKLIRKILDSNNSDSISLEAEIDTLTRYLEIENLRFEKGISYTIDVSPELVPAMVNIPVMMIQPFVENSVWHGLLNKQGDKLLAISFAKEGSDYLQCIIEDNGVGRIKVNYDISEKKSLATNFIIQRLNLLNKIFNLNCTLLIEDKPGNTGTIVKIVLPIQKNKHL